MARLIQKSGYIQGGRAARYMEYVAKRDGVEVLQSTEPVTKKQMQFFTKLLKDFPDAKELFEYNGQSSAKKVTKSNVASSVISVVNDTAINGAISAATGAFAGKAVPINNGWFKPKNFISCFAGKYARKSELQTVIQSSLLLITDGVKTDLLGDRSIQAPIISIFPATE